MSRHRKWIRRIFITISAIVTGTTFLYIKQNIHYLHAINFEGSFEEFDHPFALLFFVYLGQFLIFSSLCLASAPIRTQLLQEIKKLHLVQWLRGARQEAQSPAEDQSEASLLESADHLEENAEESLRTLFTGGNCQLAIVHYVPPAFVMLISTSFLYYAFGTTYPATIVMFRALSLGSAGILRLPLCYSNYEGQSHFTGRQWLAVLIMMSAVAHSAYFDLMSTSDIREDIDYRLTVTLLCLAHFGFALADTYDEKFLHKKRAIPLVLCFVEASLGTVVYLVIVPLLYFVPDPLYPRTQGGVMENGLNALVQIGNNGMIPVFILILVVSETIWMGSRVFITRYGNAVFKSMIDSFQLIIIRFITPHLYTYSKETVPTTVFTLVVFSLGMAVFYFSERNERGN